jgi:hypothetical protein
MVGERKTSDGLGGRAGKETEHFACLGVGQDSGLLCSAEVLQFEMISSSCFSAFKTEAQPKPKHTSTVNRKTSTTN